MYGCELWNLSSGYIDKFKTAWRKIKRRIWKLPPLTHNTIVHNLSSDINVCLEKRLIKFIHNALRSNIICKNILSIKLRCKRSCFAENYRFLSYKYNLCDSDWSQELSFLMGKVKMKLNIVYPSSPDASSIRELCKMRDEFFYDIFSPNQLNSLINDVCVN